MLIRASLAVMIFLAGAAAAEQRRGRASSESDDRIITREFPLRPERRGERDRPQAEAPAKPKRQRPPAERPAAKKRPAKRSRRAQPDADKPKAATRPKPAATRPRKPKTKPTYKTRRWLVRAEMGMVASDSAEASKAGAEILKAGGNAVDAAVATSFALGVTRPHSTGLGGGGFALIHLSRTRQTLAVDFREMAPLEATWDMYIEAKKRDPNVTAPSREGGLAVGVPGLLAGASHVLREFGTMPLSQVVGPALDLAEVGFKADREYARACNQTIHTFKKDPNYPTRFPELYRSVLQNGRTIEPGQTILRPQLAAALRMISYKGDLAIYDGQIGDEIVRAVRRSGGVLNLRDLLAYRVRERTPIRFRYRDFEILSMPPPSSGGIVIAEVLTILNNKPMPDLFVGQPGLATHYFVEACKHAFADRSRWLGDPAYADVPTDTLTSEAYAAKLAKGIDEKKTKPPKAYGSMRIVKDDDGTSHVSVVDADDNVVAWTETINTTFGSYVMTDRFGIILNNEMDDFSAEPGKPDAFGLQTSHRNAVAPAKRPLSSMSPTIVMDRNGLPIITLGGSGGPRIITSVLNVLVNMLDRDMTLGEAMEEVRLHHQWMPNEIRFSDPPSRELAAELRKRGHKIGKRRTTGIIQAIEWRPDNSLLGASDPRKGGMPAGH